MGKLKQLKNNKKKGFGREEIKKKKIKMKIEFNGVNCLEKRREKNDKKKL